MLLPGEAAGPRLLTKGLEMTRAIPSISVRLWPFAVRRSPFTVHRSPFSVRRSAFAGRRLAFGGGREFFVSGVLLVHGAWTGPDQKSSTSTSTITSTIWGDRVEAFTPNP